MSTDPNFAPPPPAPEKKGMGTGMILLLVFGIGGGLLLLVCCGGFAFFGYRMQQGMSQDPDKVRQVTGEIVTIAVPDDLKPMMSMDMSPVMKMAIYQGANQTDQLMLAQLGSMFAQGGPDQWKAQMNQQMQQQGQSQQQVQVETTTRRDVEIDGETVTFELNRGKLAGTEQEYWQVVGAFQQDGGPVILQMTVPVEQWSEERIVQLLESIE